MDIANFNFEYLRVTQGPESIQHKPEDIKSGTGSSTRRLIYYDVPLDQFERQEIRKLETELAERGTILVKGWNERETLKYLCASKFDHEKAIKKIETCIEWRKNPASRTLTKRVLSLLESGALYMYGRDRLYRPILIFDFGRVDMDQSKVKGDDFNTALTILLDIMVAHCYVPGKVENTIVLLDCRNASVTKLPIATLKSWVSIGNACFPSNLYKNFVIGPPFLLRMSWKMIENLLEKETVEKIEVIAADELQKLQQLIDPSQLEQKYGGNLPDLNAFWPPVSTFKEKVPSSPTKKKRESQDFNDILNESIHSGKFHSSRPSISGLQSIQPNKSKLGPDPFSNPYKLPEPSQYALQAKQKNELQPPQQRNTSGMGPSIDNKRPRSKNQIFEIKPGRASQGVDHSPMRVRQKDEELLKEILFSPSKNKIAHLESLNSITHLNGSMTSIDVNLYYSTNKALSPEQAKKAGYVQNNSRNTLGINESMRPTSDGYNRVTNGMEGRTSEFKFKEHVEMTNNPKAKLNGQGYKGSPGEQLKRSNLPTASSDHYRNINYSNVKSPQSQRGKDLDVSFRSERSNRLVEEWPVNKTKLLPVPQEEDDSDGEGDGINFCGLCISKRNRNKVTTNKK